AGDQEPVLDGGGAAFGFLCLEPGSGQAGQKEKHRNSRVLRVGNESGAVPPAVGPRLEKFDQVVALPPSLMAVEVLSKMPETRPPKAKTAMTMMAAMPATSRPYSTAEAPRSSCLALAALSMMVRY